ncbi:sodium:solute symporter family protein [Brachybacterium sp. Marseille-Q2903]|uniref:Sodium:solute symporter family protein n=1 Tax=Brachybacterium epidermidis TaxID=2781983 RepID=A0ABR9VZI9_9MICO|nr:sodium:solute symporter family protein [Brachybacterium epidermidis]MBE9403308.1 sodium:solute symporter family protein [Brachybacterium epidermidis]
MNITHIVVLVIYVVLMLAVGAWFGRSKQTASGEDFMLAGRSLPAPVLAGTMLATFVGSGSIIGGANFAYSYGVLPGFLFFSGTIIGTLVLIAIAKRVRGLANYTIPELFEQRFSRATRLVATIMMLVAFIGIAAYQFTGAGYIISLITPLDGTTGSILAAVLITFLALAGGLKSVAWTDYISAIMIVFALWVTLFFVIGVDLGGVSELGSVGSGQGGVFGGLSPIQMLGFALPLLALILGDQNMYQRLSSAKDEKAAHKGAILFFFGAIIMIVPIVLLAVSSAVLQPGIEPDMAVLSLSDARFTPGAIGGALLAGAFALVVTTGSSYLLTCSLNIVHDLVGQVSPKTPQNPARDMWLGRAAVLGVAVLAYVMVQFFPSVLALQMYAYTMYGATITPVVLAALFWKRATAVGALAAMLVGGVATIGWEVSGRAAEVNSVIVSLPLAIIALVVGSLLTRPKADEALPQDVKSPAA